MLIIYKLFKQDFFSASVLNDSVQSSEGHIMIELELDLSRWNTRI